MGFRGTFIHPEYAAFFKPSSTKFGYISTSDANGIKGHRAAGPPTKPVLPHPGKNPPATNRRSLSKT